MNEYEAQEAREDMISMRDPDKSVFNRARMLCPTHGPATPNEWGCPKCMHLAREALRVIARGLMPEDGGNYAICAARLSGLARSALTPNRL